MARTKTRGLTNTKCRRCGKDLNEVHTATFYCLECKIESRREYMKEWVRKNKDKRSEFYKARYFKYRKIAREKTTKIGVYYISNEFSEIIYVGRTDNFVARMNQHKAKKSPWLKEMVNVNFIEYPTYGDSLVAEAILIRDNQPKYNITGVTK